MLASYASLAPAGEGAIEAGWTFSSTKSKIAFTLAEVLITLGIIGIVAAMTLPSLILKHNKQITETALKKFYTTFNQAILMSINANGPVDSWSYHIDVLYDEESKPINRCDDIDAAFQKYLAPYMKITEKKEVKDSLGNRMLLYFFADGSAFAYYYNENRELFFFPKNAEKCIEKHPASVGSCSFEFTFFPFSISNLNQEFGLWQYHYKKSLEPSLYMWNGEEASLYSGLRHSCADGNAAYCTAIIQHNGWKVPDNYPRKISY